jgi:hypothetical protein
VIESKSTAGLVYHLSDVDDRRSVVGVTSVDDGRLFVLREPSRQQIEVYDTTTFKVQQTLMIAGLHDHLSNGLTACVGSNCLYVNDYDQSTVFKVKLSNKNKLQKWRIGWGPSGLSINIACNLVVTCYVAKKLLEYTPYGSLVREIRLQLDDLRLHPRHAVQLTNDLFVVCLGHELFSWNDDVVEVNSQGQVVISYTNQLETMTGHRFYEPYSFIC